MSEFRIDRLVGSNGQSGVELPKGVVGVLTASSGFSGDLTGAVTGNVTGNVTGDLNGNVTGNLTGNITGNVAGNVTGNLTGDVNAGVVTATSSVIVGDKFINSSGVGIGTTDTTGRNAGVGTAYGTMLYNTTTGQLEIFGTDGTWYSAATLKKFNATGGTKTNDGTYIRHVFTDPGPSTFVVSPSSPDINGEASILIVGAGGGGGVVYDPSFSLDNGKSGEFTVTIGSGGAGQLNGISAPYPLTGTGAPGGDTEVYYTPDGPLPSSGGAWGVLARGGGGAVGGYGNVGNKPGGSGGGANAIFANGAGASGTANTGGGGAGNNYPRGSSTGGQGGSGIVIIAYPTS